MNSKEDLQYRESTKLVRFALASTSSMTASFITNPIDVTKVRMQLEGELKSHTPLYNRYYKGFLRGAVRILLDEGPRGWLKGVTPSLMREFSYGGIRLGAYEPIKELFGATDPAHTPLWKKIAAGGTSGMVGSAIANPTDLVKIRMQGTKVGKRYKTTFHAFAHIFRTEGIRGLWRGVGPTVQRAMILTASQTSSYDHTKHTILNLDLMVEGLPLHIVSSITAGFVCALCTSPFDVIKTRIMNQESAKEGGGKVYKTMLDCLVKTVRSEGMSGLYKGFFPNWMRLGPHTIICFLIFERLRIIFNIRPI
ncbi:Mitochondrial substrate carrier family protein ucpB-like [Oopsacas minuta]|uniref:Mitochondrial substrate carrier family protein ucpB-like n=1 Tax=Oopsacas minuta TaxID=111878 RepID=A0AAV7KFV5_9METZ|nr:Mitochondrial substrate carrier family protein ucpB-like [Oopsacas minuta]